MRPGYLGDLNDTWFGELDQRTARKLLKRVVSSYRNKLDASIRVMDPEIETSAAHLPIIAQYYQKKLLYKQDKLG